MEAFARLALKMYSTFCAATSKKDAPQFEPQVPIEPLYATVKEEP